MWITADEPKQRQRRWVVTSPTRRTIITGRASSSTTRTRSTATRRRAATGAAQGRTDHVSRSRSSTRSKTASLLGRGGAGFPAGVKWGFCPPGVWPRYLVVNGDESEPGTYKDRVLLERDPHQLIEGCLITCLADRCSQVFLYVRGEMAFAQERHRRSAQRRLRRRLVGKNILGSTSRSTSSCTGAPGAYIVGEETALIESPRGQPGHAAAEAAVLPRGQGPVPAADDRQQRRDAVEPPVDREQRCDRVRRARLRGVDRAPA